MRPDEQAAIAAVTAARQILADAGHNLDSLTVAAALAAASECARTAGPVDVQVTGRASGDGACAAMARNTAATLAAAAETYLRHAGAENHVGQHVTGRDGTRYVITFHRPDGRSPDELLITTGATLDRLTAAVLHLADRLDVRSHDSRILSVRATLRDVCASLRDLVHSDPRVIAGAGEASPGSLDGRPAGPPAPI